VTRQPNGLDRMQRLAVIFDVDGVLVDSYRAHFQSWRLMFGEIGGDYCEELFAADFGRTSRDILRRNFGADMTDERIRELDKRKEAIYRDLIRHDFPAMDGAVELIDALVAERFLLAVGSSGPIENVTLSLEKLGRANRFAAIVTGADVTRGKPDPQVFLLAAARLGAEPAACCVVEDAAHGIEAARRAGMKSVALTGTASRYQLVGADLVVDSLRELSPSGVRDLILGQI
jgi:beta-phosphoglucomutase